MKKYSLVADIQTEQSGGYLPFKIRLPGFPPVSSMKVPILPLSQPAVYAGILDGEPIPVGAAFSSPKGTVLQLGTPVGYPHYRNPYNRIIGRKKLPYPRSSLSSHPSYKSYPSYKSHKSYKSSMTIYTNTPELEWIKISGPNYIINDIKNSILGTAKQTYPGYPFTGVYNNYRISLSDGRSFSFKANLTIIASILADAMNRWCKNNKIVITSSSGYSSLNKCGTSDLVKKLKKKKLKLSLDQQKKLEDYKKLVQDSTIGPYHSDTKSKRNELTSISSDDLDTLTELFKKGKDHKEKFVIILK